MSAEADLRKALQRMVDTFRPFTLKPVGAPGSQARADQDEQIAAHAQAVAALAGAVDPLPAFPFAWGLTPEMRAVLAALLTQDHVTPNELRKIVNSKSSQADRKVLLQLRRGLQQWVPGFEIKVVVGQGRYLTPEVKTAVRVAARG